MLPCLFGAGDPPNQAYAQIQVRLQFSVVNFFRVSVTKAPTRGSGSHCTNCFSCQGVRLEAWPSKTTYNLGVTTTSSHQALKTQSGRVLALYSIPNMKKLMFPKITDTRAGRKSSCTDETDP